MTRTKLTHILLIALLCYGQIAASSHVAGHLLPEVPQHNHSHDLRAHSSQTGSTLHQHQHAHPSANKITAGFVPNTDKNKHSDEATDCTLYHAFSNLSGTITASHLQAIAPAHCDAIFSINNVRLAHNTSNQQPIRAPPSLA